MHKQRIFIGNHVKSEGFLYITYKIDTMTALYKKIRQKYDNPIYS
ncbi:MULTISPECIES: hypothetical protein [Shouchella]|uniref:Uncharacterized protein n=1 Tax=Shouchella hunanensis TaxID=766894 RepID=A0ABY7WAU1_9BACI|nr:MULTISPECIES: hypothetical protein [Shouchella]WDF05811.1 hypothetical protein PQ477_10360 [Shouchella hunanensis]